MLRLSGSLLFLVGSLALGVACGGTKSAEGEAHAHADSEPHSHGDDKAHTHGDDKAHTHGDDKAHAHGDDKAHAHGDDKAHAHGDDKAHAHGDDKAHEGCVNPDHEGGACPHGSADASVPPGSDDTRFGAEFALAETSRHGLAKAVAKIDDQGDAPVQVTGWVGNVCQRKGCWMMLNDDGVQARVLMKGHFSVPTDSQGRAAVVEGTLAKREFTEAQAKHLADDGGQDASEVSGNSTEYVLTATAVELLPRS